MKQAPRARVRRRFARFLAVVLLSLASAAGLGVAPASATAIGGVGTDLGFLQIKVYGSGVNASRIEGVVLKPGWICNREFQAFGVSAAGRHWESVVHLAGCGWNGAYTNWYGGFVFAPNTRVCMRVRDRGEDWEPYYACIWIRR